MASTVELVLQAFQAAVRPLVRMLIRRGASYPVAAERLRQLFVEEAVREIEVRGMKPTASAVSLLSGVHRKDLRQRELAAQAPAAADAVTPGTGAAAEPALGLIGQIVGRWMSDPAYREGGRPRRLQRGTGAGSFDALVQGVSTDVGPRAVLEEMLRLQVVRQDGEHIELDTAGTVPRGDFAAMAGTLGQNVGDHAAVACANLLDGRDLLEQAIYVDEIGSESAQVLHETATRAWRPVLARVLRVAEKRIARDAVKEDEAGRRVRIRFGVYFHVDDPNQKEQE
ncbi:hypothetical protein FSC37_13670 [Piscinibacter aquaticus]|uniref:Uncharacterized protein n=1 Tax=Piscinibacter aquaticus TaxID=392597 RepID=A0A5C6U0Q6_9BURK|nr:hypothetical protein FSC37_13670 [Piscinibacter aquaticus]